LRDLRLRLPAGEDGKIDDKEELESEKLNLASLYPETQRFSSPSEGEREFPDEN